jgi:hypothetical protein
LKKDWERERERERERDVFVNVWSKHQINKMYGQL